MQNDIQDAEKRDPQKPLGHLIFKATKRDKVVLATQNAFIHQQMALLMTITENDTDDEFAVAHIPTVNTLKQLLF